jgi:hypothetical protein
LRLDEWQRYIDSEFLEEPGDEETAGKLPRPGDTAAPAATANGFAALSEVTKSAVEAPDPIDVGADIGEAATAVSLEWEAPIVEAPETAQPVSFDDLSSDVEPSDADPTDSASFVEEFAPDTRLYAETPAAPEPATGASIARTETPLRGTFEGSDSTGIFGVEIAPFADYIAVRRHRPEFSPTLDLEYSTAETNEPAERNALGDARPDSSATLPTAGHSGPPLAATEATLAHLGRASGSEPRDGGVRERQEALLRRLCDPQVSLEEAALLLGVSPVVALQFAEQGLLPIAESEMPATGGEAGRRSEGPYFSLSSVVALRAAGEQTPDL